MRPLGYALLCIGSIFFVVTVVLYGASTSAEVKSYLATTALICIGTIVAGVCIRKSDAEPERASRRTFAANVRPRDEKHELDDQPAPSTAIKESSGRAGRPHRLDDDLSELPRMDVSLRQEPAADAAAGLALILPALAIPLMALLFPIHRTLICWGTIALTAAFLGIDAGLLGRTDRTGLRRESPLIIFLGTLLFWVLVFPLAFFRRRHFGRPNWGGQAIFIELLFCGVALRIDYQDWRVAEQQRLEQHRIAEAEGRAAMARQAREQEAQEQVRKQHEEFMKKFREQHRDAIEKAEAAHQEFQERVREQREAARLQREAELQARAKATERLNSKIVGQSLLIVSRRNGNAEIFLINADGSGLRNLSNNKAENRLPAWSPDGQRIAFDSTRADGLRNVFVMDADGGNVRQITKLANAMHPSWSPDGKAIAFASIENDAAKVMIVNVADLAVKEVGPGQDPAWSPDGRRILYARRTDKGFRPAVMDIDGGKSRDLTNSDNKLGYTSPAWSPDGKKIAWTDQMGIRLQLMVANADGSHRRRLPTMDSMTRYVAWSNDGAVIAYQIDAGARGQIFFIDVETGHFRRFLEWQEPLVEGGRPAWRPAIVKKK